LAQIIWQAVNFYDYVYDRVAGQFKLLSLAELMLNKRNLYRVDLAFSVEFKVDTYFH
jgi:hypothetical protein